MTRRPSFATKRPLSAIFLGNVPNSHVPDLPEPPSSPKSSSGLPSPPATNSTGSGGSGDNSTSAGSIRIPSLGRDATMLNGEKSSQSVARSGDRSSSDEGDDGGDEDHTARLSADRGQAARSGGTDSASALQRVKSLAERNRLVLGKLASISSGSRLSTPSPSNGKRASRSPAPSATSNAASSSRLSLDTSRRESVESFNSRLSGMSGSETEREREQPFSAVSTASRSSIAFSSSDDLSITPPSASTVPFGSDTARERRISAPTSPGKALTDRGIGIGDTSTFGRRALRSESRASGVEAAALAAVASSRRSPSAGKRRQPLPREFRPGESRPRTSMESRPSFDRPFVFRRDSDQDLSATASSARDFSSPTSQAATLNDSPQSARARAHRFSTVREMTRRHQTRWLSQDLTSPPRGPLDDEGRLQERRGNSNESPLALPAGSRSVIGESLRAAGLARRRDDADDPFAGESSLQVGRRLRLSGELGVRPPLLNGSRMDVRPGTRITDRPGTSDSVAYNEPRTPLTTTQRLTERNALTVAVSRPSTSMAAYNEEPRTAPPLLRSHKSVYPIPEKERQPETARPPSQARNLAAMAGRERTSSSPSALVRRAAVTPLNGGPSSEASAEHVRLMLDSLSMFESHLARLPSMGSTTTITIPELYRSAQSIVQSTNLLNTLLKEGTARALERQIDAELSDDQPIDPVQIWLDVGAEMREGMRVSDELVRTMTSFLLGVGKVLRETGAERSHNRTTSLDDPTRRLTPDIRPNTGTGRATSDGKLSTDGRSSIEVKRRWGDSSGEMNGSRTTLSSTQSSSSRPSTSLLSRADPGADIASLSEDRMDMRRKFSKLALTTRRLMSFQDSREGKETLDSPLHTADPSQQSFESPTVLAQQRNLSELSRRRTIAVPPPLPTLPSESLLARQGSNKSAMRRAKVSSTSNATVRAGSIFPSLSTSSNATTAVTAMAVQASPERPSMPVARSSDNVRSTLSRSTGAAFAGLQQQYERDGRQRTLSTGSTLETDLRQARSGSETERPPRASIERPRMSLDSNASTTRPGTASVRYRRGTVTSLFTRG